MSAGLRRLGWLVALAVLLADLGVKLAMRSWIGERPPWNAVVLLPQTLYLHVVENPVGTFGFLFALPEGARPWFFGIAGLLFVALLAWLLRRTVRRPDASADAVVALGMMLGGVLGNMIDRLVHGAVTDWLVVEVGDEAPEQFWLNLADVAIYVGLLLFAISLLRKPREATPAPPAA